MKTLLLIVVLIFIFFNQNSYVDIKDYRSQYIHVEIKGEVKNPGVYKMKYNAKIEDVLNKSGGFTASADSTGINQTKTLKNEDVIVIGKKTDIEKVSINSGTLETLSTLPGIGQATAQKIIDYRESYGSFQTLEDIQKVKGIKEKLFEKIKDHITL
ncbi:competence protein ComEA [Breznakia sp. PF5-3]|uniref:ComEA family DNA-binding protein n=1 Tax=unclassified Breznakia TaxID=2623764 RepID=UPI002407210D|nr:MULTISPECIES: ComEA family DNA-binding protein [unclassified Breznakia]MDL2276116.1 ComEA family DNA-binding protein [Breznakia sp. OttesenSCG-928-G09]MDF9824436.1 competence protein ComEA [Breznakia sp. PM6-1]MDF9835165.1 competence protein ComEA [Breznakia sp. PF5-3]MDF9838310.1 competence protein ComEA [Breznakia sp. PFB2-8]MDF9860326.1 competence protein ComEA [Breznakia sp. PH5-24]